VVVLENARKRSRHEGLAQPHHVAYHDTAALVQVVSRNLYRRFLELKELVAEVAGDAELRQTGTRFLRKVIGRLDIDVIRRDGLGTCPTVVDDFDEFFRNVDTEPVIPAILKPCRKLVASVMGENINVEFALF